MEERKPLVQSFVGSNNCVTESEWSSLVEETKHLTISGLKDHICFAKEKVEEEVKHAEYWIQYETAEGLRWTPCPPDWKGAEKRCIINLSNTYKPKLRYKDLTNGSDIEKSTKKKSGKKNWTEKMRLSDEELKALSGIKSTNESYSTAQYETYMKTEPCFK